MNPPTFFDRFNALVKGGWLGKLDPTACNVYLVYLAHADADGVAYPSNATVAAALGQKSSDHVRRARAILEKQGLLTRKSFGGTRPGDTSRFVVNVPPCADSAQVCDNGPCAKPAQVCGTGCLPCAESDGYGVPNRRTEQPIEQPKEQQGGATRRAPRRKPTGDHQELITHFVRQWEAKYATPYKFTPKDAKAVQSVLATCDGLAHAQRVVDCFLGDTSWVQTQCHPLPLLASQINKYRAMSKSVSGNGDCIHPNAPIIPPTADQLAAAYPEEVTA